MSAEDLYLDLVKKCLTRAVFEDGYRLVPATNIRTRLARGLARSVGGELIAPVEYDSLVREKGRDWPAQAETMVGMKRLDNVQACVTDVLRRGVPGDLVETGVWRGGVTILMRAILGAYNDTTRVVWVADSFEGLPKPDRAFEKDAGDTHWQIPELAVSLEQVQDNFRRYGLLDDQVQFLPGWFKDTLTAAPMEQIAVLRLDGDMYESTIEALEPLYPKLAPGGYAIIDDYKLHPACAAAVDEYRATHGITEAIEEIDWQGVYWRRDG